jgi:hypothetical protein
MNEQVMTPEVVETRLAKIDTSESIAADESVALRSAFRDHYGAAVAEIEKAKEITDPTAEGAQKKARTVRLAIKAVRVDAEKTRKRLKEAIVRRGRAIDGYARIIEEVCAPTEERLAEIEKHAEIMEAKRIKELVDARTFEVMAAGGDPAAYRLDIIDDAAFAALLDTVRMAAKARKEQEAKAEAERIERERADAVERERIRLENERLKEEAKAREEAARVEREKAAAELARVEAERKREREEAEAKAKAEREAAEKAKREADAKAKAEREAAERAIASERSERERLQREADAKAKAEAARIEAERIAKAKAAQAPDREKIIAFAQAVSAVALPMVSTDEASKAVAEIADAQKRFVAWIGTKAGAL